MADSDLYTTYTPNEFSADQHTMLPDHLLAYVDSKLNAVQRGLLTEHRQSLSSSLVLGLPSGRAPDWIKENGLVIRETAKRLSREGKKYNNVRSTLYLCERGNEL